MDIPDEARIERLQRRAAALERQLDTRIAQVEALQKRLAEQAAVLDTAHADAAAAHEETERWRTEYEALMNTRTMRALRLPRAWYAAVRRRLARP